MKASEAILAVQTTLLIPEATRQPRIGPLTRARLQLLSTLPPDAEWDVEAVNAIVTPGATDGTKSVAERTEPDAIRLIPKIARELVEAFEGCQLKAYQDEVGVWTIGFGHTGLQHKDGTVSAGRVISQEKADQLLDYDMQQFEARVAAVVRVPLSDYAFGALVAFDFNTGGLDDSTLLTRLNAGLMGEAADQFLRWNHAGGKVLNGLTRRRSAERALFLGDVDKARLFMRG